MNNSLLYAVLVLAAWPAGVFGQTITASLSGTVMDPNGALVPGATVTASSQETGLKRTVKADQAGRYILTFLPPGVYSFSAEATGFSPTAPTQVRLEVAQGATLDFSLAVAGTQQSIDVNAEVQPLLTTETGGLERTLENKLIEDLPSAQRNTLGFLTNMAGVVDMGTALATGETQNTNGSAVGAIGSPGNRNFFDSNFTVNGGQLSTNDVLLDGVSNTFADFNGIAVSPPQDSVREFKVLSGVFSAAYGRSGGGIINIVTQSGGRDFHGKLYEYFQNGNLNANGWQRNRAGFRRDGTMVMPRIPIKRNQFGGSIGGPIYLPRTGRSANTFFFFNYEGRRELNPYSATLTMPTAKMRTGDLSELLQPSVIRQGVPLNADGAPPIYGQVYSPYGTLAQNPQGAMVRHAISGNRLDLLPKCGTGPRTSPCLDPVGLALMSYLPLPNTPGLTDNYVYSGTVPFNRDLYALRIDRTFARHNLFGRFSKESRSSQDAPDFLHSVASASRSTYDMFLNVTVNDVYTLSPSSINNLRYGLTRSHPQVIPIGQTQNYDLTTLGLPAYILNFQTVRTFPAFNFTSAGPQHQGLAGEITSGIIGWGYNNQPRDTQTLANTVTILKGPHSMTAGAEYRLWWVSA